MRNRLVTLALDNAAVNQQIQLLRALPLVVLALVPMAALSPAHTAEWHLAHSDAWELDLVATQTVVRTAARGKVLAVVRVSLATQGLDRTASLA